MPQVRHCAPSSGTPDPFEMCWISFHVNERWVVYRLSHAVRHASRPCTSTSKCVWSQAVTRACAETDTKRKTFVLLHMQTRQHCKHLVQKVIFSPPTSLVMARLGGPMKCCGRKTSVGTKVFIFCVHALRGWILQAQFTLQAATAASHVNRHCVMASTRVATCVASL